jgi:outer membrane protein
MPTPESAMAKPRPVLLPLFRCVTFAALLLGAGSVLAAVDDATLARAEALIKEGKADAAYQMLEPLETQGAGDLVYDYLLATAALDSNRPNRATFVYERILAVEPNYVGVRADMGRAYYALGDLGRAKIEFETVLSFPNLPPDLRTQVELYNKAVVERSQQKKLTSTVYAELTYGYDSNVNSGTSDPDVLKALNPGFASLTRPGFETGDQYVAVAVGGELNYLINAQYSAYFGADLRKRAYREWDDADNWSADARLGLSYSGGSWLLKGGLTGGTYAQGDAGRVRDSAGVNLDWRLALDNSTQLTAGASAVRYTYVTAQSSNDNNTYTGSFGGLKVLTGGSVLSLSASVGNEKPTGVRDDGDKRFYGLRLQYQLAFTPTLSAFLSGGATKNAYQGTNLLYAIRRDETTSDVTVGASWLVGKGLALRPQFTYIRNESNAALYTYDKTDASLNLRWDY